MSQTHRRRCFRMIALCALLAASGGCGWNRFNQTSIIVRFSSDKLLHVALLPRELPDGRPALALRAELLEELGENQPWVLIERTTALLPGAPARPADLLLVEGPPQLGFRLREKLREDFQQKQPWVIGLPTQAVAFFATPESQEGGSASGDGADGPGGDAEEGGR